MGSVKFHKNVLYASDIDARQIANSSACIGHIDFSASTFDSISGAHVCNVETPALKAIAHTDTTYRDLYGRYISNYNVITDNPVYSRNIIDATAHSGQAIECYGGHTAYVYLSNSNGLNGDLESGKSYYVYVRAKSKGTINNSYATVRLYNYTTAENIVAETTVPLASITTSYASYYCFHFTINWTITNNVAISFFNPGLGSSDYSSSIIIDSVEIWPSGIEKTVLDFTMNEINGTNLLDCSPNLYTGIINGARAIVESVAIGGNALYFNGTNTYVTCNSVCTNLTSSFSIVGRFKFSTLSETRALWSICTSSGEPKFVLRLHSGKIELYCNQTTLVTITTTNVLSENVWYKIFVTLNANNNTAIVYINDIQAGISNSITARVLSTDLFSIGQVWLNNTATNFFNGAICFIKAYSSVILPTPLISPESGKNLINMLEVDWQDPNNWNLANGTSTLTWDPVENALCGSGTGQWNLTGSTSTAITASNKGLIFIDPSKHWYLEATISTNSTTGSFRLGTWFCRSYRTQDDTLSYTTTYDYWGADDVIPSTINKDTTYKNNTLSMLPRTNVANSNQHMFNISPRVTHAGISIVVNYNDGTILDSTYKYWIKDLKLYYIDPDDSNSTVSINGRDIDNVYSKIYMPSKAFNTSTIEGAIVVKFRTEVSVDSTDTRCLLDTNRPYTKGGFLFGLFNGNLPTFRHSDVTSTYTANVSGATVNWSSNTAHCMIINFSQSSNIVTIYIDSPTTVFSTTSSYINTLLWDHVKLDIKKASTVTSADFIYDMISFYSRVLTVAEVTKILQAHMTIENNNIIVVRNISEQPPAIPSTATYFPFNNIALTNELNTISPVTASNIEYTNDGIFIGTGVTNLVTSTYQTFEGWTVNSGATVTITQLSNKFTRIQSSGGTALLKYYLSLGTSSNVPYTASMYVYNIGSTNCVIDCNLSAVITNSNLPITQTIVANDFMHVHLGTVGDGSTSLQLNISTSNISDSLDILVYQPMCESNSVLCSPFTSISRGASVLTYNLYAAGLINWNANWSIGYWKIPIGATDKSITGSEIQTLGSYNIGKVADQFQINPGTLSYSSYPDQYFNKLQFVCIRYTTGSLILDFYGSFGHLSNTVSTTISSANAFVVNGHDIVFNGSNLYMPFGFIAEQRTWTDDEVYCMCKTIFKLKENTLTNPNIILKGNKGSSYITGNIYEDNTWFLIP